MRISENWVHGLRPKETHERDNKKVHLFTKIRTSMHFHGLKQRVRETNGEGKVWMYGNNSKLEHVKRISVLSGACVPCASLE